MRRTLHAAAAAAALAAGLTLAQTGPGASPPYRVADETVVKGKVAEVKVVPDWMGAEGYNILLQTPEGATVHVDTATARFLRFLEFTVAPGDGLEITGCWAEVNGEKTFLARRIRKMGTTIAVRDAEGRPVW